MGEYNISVSWQWSDLVIQANDVLAATRITLRMQASHFALHLSPTSVLPHPPSLSARFFFHRRVEQIVQQLAMMGSHTQFTAARRYIYTFVFESLWAHVLRTLLCATRAIIEQEFFSGAQIVEMRIRNMEMRWIIIIIVCSHVICAMCTFSIDSRFSFYVIHISIIINLY